MERVLYLIFRDYGLHAVQLGVVCYFGWKIMTNHLKHIQDGIDRMEKKLELFDEEQKQIISRIAHIEGKLS